MITKETQKVLSHAFTEHVNFVVAKGKLDHFEKQWADKRRMIDHYFVHRRGRWFDHCFLMLVYLGGGLRIESLWARLDIEPMDQLQAVTALEAFIECGWTVEKVEPQAMPIVRIPGLGTCVSVTKRVLGINKPWIFTARQLARYINGVRDRSETQKGWKENQGGNRGFNRSA